MAVTAEQCKQLWYRALGAEIGVALEVAPEDIHATRIQLYNVRRELDDPELEVLSIFEPEPLDGKSELWVIKKATELPDA